MRKYNFDLESVELTPQTLGNYEATIIATDHDLFDYKVIQKHSKLIVDTRGSYRDREKKVVKA
jgi:UDP-N-acetyl-D-glucosamine dehydrogenase